MSLQAVHGIGGLTGLNDVVSKVTKRALERTLIATADKLRLTRTLERMSEAGIKALGETAAKSLEDLLPAFLMLDWHLICTSSVRISTSSLTKIALFQTS